MTGNKESENVEGDFVDIHNNRKDTRRPASLQLRVTLLAEPGAPEITLEVHDMSTRGIGLCSRRSYPERTLMALRLPSTPDTERMVLCQIKYCRGPQDGSYAIGAEFMESIAQRNGSPMPPHWIELATKK